MIRKHLPDDHKVRRILIDADFLADVARNTEAAHGLKQELAELKRDGYLFDVWAIAANEDEREALKAAHDIFMTGMDAEFVLTGAARGRGNGRFISDNLVDQLSAALRYMRGKGRVVCAHFLFVSNYEDKRDAARFKGMTIAKVPEYRGETSLPVTKVPVAVVNPDNGNAPQVERRPYSQIAQQLKFGR